MLNHWIGKPKVAAYCNRPLFAALLALVLAIACGTAATATPVPPTATRAPVAETAPTATRAVPTATAAPTPTAGPAVGRPVAERLKVAMTPPGIQSTVGWLGPRSAIGQILPMYEALLRDNDVTGAFDPMLATEWELSKDATSMRWKLRQGVPFHTGKEFTAKDVVFSYETVVGADSVHSNVATYKEFFKSKDDVEIVNDYEVVYHLRVPGFTVPYFSSDIQGHIIYSRDHWDAIGGTTKAYVDNPTGTGPFRFREFKEGQYILFEALDRHWRKVPDFKELQIFYVPEAVTRVAQLVAEEVHIAEIDRSLKSQIFGRGLKVEPATLAGITVGILFGGNHLPDKRVEGPLSNLLVRQALNLAFDREAIQKTIFGDDGELAEAWHIYKTDEAFNPGWKVYPYDPVKAKELLVQAGYPNGFSMDLWTARFPGAPELPEVAEATATMWKQIGVDVKIVESEFSAIRSRYLARSFTGTEAWTMRGGVTPHYQTFQGYFVSPTGGGGPVFAFEDAFLEEQWRKFVNSADPVERRSLSREMADFTYNNYATVPLLWLSGLAGIDPKVVVEYKCHTLASGPVRCHEYTQVVRR
jgi:dipeptide transport system substrate-binding protein